MYHGACPTPDELGVFLDERLEPRRQEEIGTHVDMCLACQTMLEALTQRRAFDLIGLSTESFRGLAGHRVHDQHSTDEAEGIGYGSNGLQVPDHEGEPSSQVDGDSPLDPDRTVPYIPPTGPRADTDRTESDLRSDLPPIAGYELLDVLGEGGMGVVYKARQLGLNRLVAVKMIRRDRPGGPERKARFLIEAEAVARLRHPNIVQIFEIGETAGAPFVSLELLEGGSLDHRLASTPQPGRPAAELLITLARAVQFAHDAGIIHRDLKPSNILFAEDGIPKITDFGLAKRLESDSRQTESGQIMGSPSYMAPEQARGHTKDVRPAADVYALGAILYEMLTGRPPFKGETPMETLRQVTDDEVVPPSRLVPRVARDLETICLHCLNKEPSRRYGSAQALVEDLESFLAGHPIKARPTPFWERGVKLARRHPVAAALLAFAFVATVGSTLAWLEHSSREHQRLANLRSTITMSLFRAQDLVAHERWDEAEKVLISIRTDIRGERELTDLATRAGTLVAQAQQGGAAQKTKSHDQERLGTFRQRRQDALFHETHFPGLGLPYEQETVKSSARAVLAVFAPEGDGEAREFGPLPESLAPREHDEIKEGCVEMLLILADAEPSPERGLELLDQAGRLGPPTRAYHLRRAACLDRQGDTGRAQSERDRAKSLVLDSALDHYLLGKALYKRREWFAALPHLDAALLRQPGHFWAHCLSAVCRMQLGHVFQAKTDLNACLQIESGLPWLYELRGFASYQIATLARAAAESMQTKANTLRSEVELQLQAAEADYASALKLLDAAPSKDLLYTLLVNRGMVWLERREWDKAVVDLQEAIKLDGRRSPAFENLAQVYVRQNKPDLAIDQFTRAIGLHPDWAPLYRARASVNLERKDQGPPHRARALTDLERAIRLEPPGSAVVALDQARRARLLLTETRHEEALAACDTALRINGDHLEAHLVRIEVLRKLNRYADAIRSCDALMGRGKPSAELYELRGLAREKIKDYLGAIEDYTLAIGLQPKSGEMRGAQPQQPKSAEIWARRGVLYLVTDAPRSALRDFQEAVRLDSRSADAYVGRGLALAALGQHREAVADAAKALGVGEPTTIRLYSAARIYAQAAYSAGALARKEGQEAVSLFTRYQDRAMSLLREWLKRLPAGDRAPSLRDLQEDPAMAILRRRLRSLDLAKTS
ncbi:MAG: protein kinase domain-containing protein [Isosphaeraceae bacterium]